VRASTSRIQLPALGGHALPTSPGSPPTPLSGDKGGNGAFPSAAIHPGKLRAELRLCRGWGRIGSQPCSPLCSPLCATAAARAERGECWGRGLRPSHTLAPPRVGSQLLLISQGGQGSPRSHVEWEEWKLYFLFPGTGPRPLPSCEAATQQETGLRRAFPSGAGSKTGRAGSGDTGTDTWGGLTGGPGAELRETFAAGRFAGGMQGRFAAGERAVGKVCNGAGWQQGWFGTRQACSRDAGQVCNGAGLRWGSWQQG